MRFLSMKHLCWERKMLTTFYAYYEILVARTLLES